MRVKKVEGYGINTSKIVADRIVKLCKEKDVTVGHLATMKHVQKSTINDILSGKTKNTGIITIKMLCDGLGISLAEFFDTDTFRHLEQEIR